jgi:GDP-4-dehydro-6-deoxy-D-mannose reductase
MKALDEGPILITGATGFVGRYLAAALAARFPERDLILADRAPARMPEGEVVALDVTDPSMVDEIVRTRQPAAVAHLAAVAAVTSSFADPRDTWRVNMFGTLNVVLAIQAHAPTCRLLFVSSAEVYGRSTFSGAPVTESALLLPANPYAATKAAADIMVQEACGRGLHATVIRPFNHTGPGQTEAFAIPAFCAQIARIEKGMQPPVIKVGELDDERDFLDVADIVDLYVTVIERGAELEPGLVLNAASGQTHRIRSVLEILLAESNVDIKVEVDPARLRKTRVPRVVGDAARAHAVLGWKPTRPFEQTLKSTLQYWRERP